MKAVLAMLMRSIHTWKWWNTRVGIWPHPVISHNWCWSHWRFRYVRCWRTRPNWLGRRHLITHTRHTNIHQYMFNTYAHLP